MSAHMESRLSHCPTMNAGGIFIYFGRTGTGKTSFLEGLIRQDIAEGRGLCLIDFHSDLSHKIADSIPTHRIEDTIYFDPFDTHVVGFNPLSKYRHLRHHLGRSPKYRLNLVIAHQFMTQLPNLLRKP